MPSQESREDFSADRVKTLPPDTIATALGIIRHPAYRQLDRVFLCMIEELRDSLEVCENVDLVRGSLKQQRKVRTLEKRLSRLMKGREEKTE